MATKTKTTKCPGCGLSQPNGPETTSGRCLDCDRTSPSTGNNLKGDYQAYAGEPAKKIKSETGLFWSEAGEIGCAEHSPFYLSDTWRSGRWVPLTHADLKVLTFKAACETCKRVPSSV